MTKHLPLTRRTREFYTAQVAAWLGAVLASTASQARAQYDPDWYRHVRVGGIIGFNISADFHRSGQFGISGSQPGPVGVSGANHFYDDGYVRVDQTGNAQGYTSYFGYDNPSQYNAATHSLLMHSATSFTTSGGSSKDDTPYFGCEIEYGVSPWHMGPIRVGLDVGFGFLPISIKDSQSTAGTFQQSTFSFDTGGIVLPSAPYNGGSSGVGPTIHDVATAVSSTTLPGTISGSQTLDATLYSFRLGPSFFYDLSQSFGLSAGVGGALGVIPADLKFNESIVTSAGNLTQNSGKVSDTQLAYGGYVNVMLTYHVERHGDIYIGAQYLPMTTTTFSGDGREARLKLSGQAYISAGFNWPF